MKVHWDATPGGRAGQHCWNGGVHIDITHVAMAEEDVGSVSD